MSCFVMVSPFRPYPFRSSRRAAALNAANIADGGVGAAAWAAGPCFARIARGRAFAPARFARLIARASRRTHLSHAFHSGFSKPVPPAARRRGSGSGCRLSGSYIGIFTLMSSSIRNKK